VDVDNLVAILLGVLALAAIFAAGRVAGRSPAGRRAAPGYLMFAAGAALQGADLLRGTYNTVLAVIATLLIVVGLAMVTRAWASRTADA
jgi:hypothetical protein